MAVSTIRGGRKQWVDALRGIAILLVVYGHNMSTWDEFFIFTSPIKIPLFFAITGYVLNTDASPVDFLKKWFTRLVIPYYLLAIIPIAISLPFYPTSESLEKIRRVIVCESYWFLPCMMFGNLFFYFVNHYVKKMQWRAIVIVILSVVGYLFCIKDICSMAYINLALEVQLFYFIGRVFKVSGADSFNGMVRNILQYALAILYITLCIISMYIFPKQSLDVHVSSYYNIPLCLVLILLGLAALFLIAPKVKLYPKSVVYIGQNTLLIYMWAPFVGFIMELFLKEIKIDIPHSIISGIIMATIEVLVCSVLSIFINKYLPFMVGKTKK